MIYDLLPHLIYWKILVAYGLFLVLALGVGLIGYALARLEGNI